MGFTYTITSIGTYLPFFEKSSNTVVLYNNYENNLLSFQKSFRPLRWLRLEILNQRFLNSSHPRMRDVKTLYTFFLGLHK